eukprot:gb/GECG01002220.1/.p1 GENE.gb/GECG01002220.1/~~gb/GECG01002220.1/.p1  ORF type:complete len:270 (+),score=40.16 gb/GECG01002220.1/:1-810(+)
MSLSQEDAIKEAKTLVPSLQSAAQGSLQDVQKAFQNTLPRLKVLLTAFGPFGAQTTASSSEEAFLACNALEASCLICLRAEDFTGFERQVYQLRTIYSEYESTKKSESRPLIVALLLMHLLVENRLAEFHSELELLNMDERKNKHIEFAVELEERMMEGAYHKVLHAAREPPAQVYKIFLDKLTETVRSDIADCLAASYERLPVQEAAKKLQLSSQNAVQDFVKHNDLNWKFEGSDVVFVPSDAKGVSVQSRQLIENTLHYATELEKIV